MDRRLLFVAIAIIIVGAIYTTSFLKSDISGNLGTGFTINYEDGTSRTIDPMSNPFALKPLKVTDSTGNTISDISWSTYAKLSWSGDITENTVSGTVEVIDGSGTIRQSYSFTKTDLTSGTKTLLRSNLIGADTLEQWATDGSGSVTVKVTSTAKITSSDGEVISKSASAQSTFSYSVSSDAQITDYSVTSWIGPYTAQPGPL
jgi:hypothetical protein